MSEQTMSMNRIIHGAVRRDLGRFRTALAAFTEGDRARAEALHRAWENFDTQLTEHHEGEHEIAWPAMRKMGIEDSVLTTWDSEHDAMAAALAEARSMMDALARSATRGDADAAAAAMERLEDTTTAHLDAEELVTEPLYAEHKDHPVIKEMGRKFGKQPPGKAGVFMAWVQDGASADEMTALRASVPGPVLLILGGLFGRRYRREVAPVWSS